MISTTELKQKQNIIYRTLENAFKYNRVSQSYLFIGNKGSVMLDTAYLLAKNILTSSDSFKDVEGELARRIDEGTFADLIVIDGSNKSIKKEQILLVQDQFSKTAIEAYGKKVYIINAVENTSPEAINGLLKFLEEPSSDVYAILITYQIDNVLDTIISRCQNMKFKANLVEDVVNESLSRNILIEDANIVGRIVNDANKVEEIITSKHYANIKSEVLEFLDAFQKNPNLGGIHLQNFYKDIGKPKKFDKNDYRLLIDIMIVLFQEVISKTFDGDEMWNKLRDNFDDEKGPKYLKALLETKDEIRSNANVGLVLDKLLYKLNKM